MNIQDFLQHILPAVGLRATVSIGSKGARQEFHTTNESAAAALLKADKQGRNAYHACATFKDDTSRKAANVEAVKAFWLDIDSGEGKPYETIQAAGAALKTFCDDLSLPPPTVVVSGRGLHVYWTLEEHIAPDEWLPTAKLLKRACELAQFYTGPERTADIASILRPVDTHHRKADPIPVRALNVGPAVPHDYFRQKLLDYIGEDTGTDELGPTPSHVTADNSDLAVQYDGPLPDADALAAGCAIIREFKETGGADMSEPTWRAAIGVVRHCEDGDAIVHAWSSQYDGYSYEETQDKLDRLKVGNIPPTTCEVLGAERRDVCAVCPLRGTCKSPIKAGYTAQPVTEIEVPAEDEDAEPTKYIIPPPPHKDFEFTDRGIVVTIYKKQDDGTLTATKTQMTDVLFYACAKTQDQAKEYSTIFRVHATATEVYDFTVPNEVIGEGGSKLMGILAKHQITIDRTMVNATVQYVKAWVSHQRRNATAVKTFSHYGWQPTGFILGDKMFQGNSQQAAVILTDGAKNKVPAFEPVGDLATWKAIIDRAYNNERSVAMQFAILASMGTPLLRMFEDYGGITIYMHTEDSGQGKTTVERAALSVWGQPSELIMPFENITLNAINARLGTLRNIPVVIDELTAMENKQAAELVHMVASGTPKERCDTRGNIIERSYRWQTFMLSSGNVLLSEKVRLHRSHAQAEIARLWEYTLPDMKENPIIPVSEAIKLFPRLNENYGHAGQVLTEYIVTNYDAVRQLLLNNHSKLGAKLGMRQDERYWHALISAVVTIHTIARQIELVQFDLPVLLGFIRDTLTDMRGKMTTSAVKPADLFSEMVQDLWPGFLVTQGAGDLYKGQDAFVLQKPMGALVGRVIVRQPGMLGAHDIPALYISASAAERWCSKRRVSAAEVFAGAVKAGLILPTVQTRQLGRGSSTYSQAGGPIRVWAGDPLRLAASSPAAAAHLSILPGGKTGS